jgi:hypothetical protein
MHEAQILGLPTHAGTQVQGLFELVLDTFASAPLEDTPECVVGRLVDLVHRSDVDFGNATDVGLVQLLQALAQAARDAAAAVSVCV